VTGANPTTPGAAPAVRRTGAVGGKAYARRGKYLLFAAPALILIALVIVFPWAFTLYMSFNDWTIGGAQPVMNFPANYVKLASDERFFEAVLRTLYYTALAVIVPVVAGMAAAVVFHNRFPLRGLARGIFILPMMATPSAIALVWKMMFHVEYGVLNYLLDLAGIPPFTWVFAANTVIPSLVLVEVWQWTPLIMIIVLGGLAALPTEPYESALIDGANPWQLFRHITWPLVLPFLMVAVMIRTIDALKAFDTIFVISEGGPGTASETINIFLYLQAFAFLHIGYASAVVVVFFAIIVIASLGLVYLRQRTVWT